MKGNHIFAKREEKEIKLLISEKVISPRQDQKQIREKLRKNHGFYISDFTSSKKGFTLSDFENLIKNGKIKIV